MTAGFGEIIVSAIGTLRHWRQEEDASQWLTLPQDHWHGAYRVGDAGFNVTPLSEVELDFDAEGKPWSYKFPLTGDLELLIVWQPDSFGPPRSAQPEL